VGVKTTDEKGGMKGGKEEWRVRTRDKEGGREGGREG